MDKKELTIDEKRKSNCYNAQRMIYYDLPVLISKIASAAFANYECVALTFSIKDMKFIEGFFDETEKTFHIAMKGQKKQIIEMLTMQEEGEK